MESDSNSSDNGNEVKDFDILVSGGDASWPNWSKYLLLSST
jgi:hypothetical protein